MEWDEARAHRVVTGLVRRKCQLFAAFPEFGKADLVSEGMIAARRAHATFQAGKASWVTWIYRCVSSHLIDLSRSRMRRAAREAKVARPDAVAPAEIVEAGAGAGGEERPLVDQLRDVYVKAKVRLGGRKVRGGRKWYSPAQAAACLWLRAKLGLSYQELALLLADREDLRRVLGVLRKPSVRACKRFVRKVAEFGDKTSGWVPAPRQQGAVNE